MPLPIMIFFDRGFDVLPKETVKNILPDLCQAGYHTLCLTGPRDLFNRTITDHIEQHITHTQATQHTAKSENNNIEIDATSLILMRDIIQSATQHKMMIQDVNANNFTHNIDLKNIIDHLLELHNKYSGIVFICNVYYAKKLLELFDIHHMMDQIIFYFLYSDKKVDHSIDDVQQLKQSGIPEENCRLLHGGHDISVLKEEILSTLQSKYSAHHTSAITTTSDAMMIDCRAINDIEQATKSFSENKIKYRFVLFNNTPCIKIKNTEIENRYDTFSKLC